MNKKEKALIIAKDFVNDKNIICFEKHFYLFNEGIWRLESDENTEAWITTEYMKKHNDPPTSSDVREIIKYITVYTYDKYRKSIKYLNEHHISNSINTNSGILNLNTLEIKPYTKEDFCFYKLPFDYKDNPNCPIMMDFLTSSLNFDLSNPDTDINEYKEIMTFIQEWMGYTLVGGNKLHKSLIMIGSGRNGKGTLQHIWEYIIGTYNCSFVDLKYLNDGSQIFMTRNKLVNFSSDLESGLQLDTGIIKSVVAGEKVVSNEKYKGQVFITPTAKLVISCNELPYIRNVGAAIKQRFFILPFTRIFSDEEQDKDLKYKLEKEADNIFSWAVQGYKRLTNRNNFITPKRCLYGMDNYLKLNDSIQLWLDEDTIENKEIKARTTDLKRAYVDFCKQSNLKPYGVHKFYNQLEEKGFERRCIDGTWYFEGLALSNQVI